MLRLKTPLQVLGLVAVLLVFFVSIELMGDSFKLMGKDFARTLLETTSNPFVGLFIGVLATSLVQSSSTVTAMTVSIVAGGGLTVGGAIPIMLGANIGTSVTNTIVALGSITRKNEFQRAMAGATVHDFFNLIAVAILFPLELTFQVISTSSAMLTDVLAGVGGTDLLNPLKAVTDPVVDAVIGLMGENGILVLLSGLVLLFISLRYMVVLLKTLVLGRSEGLLHRYIFAGPLVSMLCGLLLTFLVQSSSITTSITVPLVAAGLVTVHQIFPFVLGANVGTTMTSIVAALALASGGEVAGIAALNVAFAHLFFNLYGILIIYPVERIRAIPIRLAEWLGVLAAKNRLYALGYIVTIFFVIPLVMILATRNLDFEHDAVLPESMLEAPADTTAGAVPAVPPAQLDSAAVDPPAGGQ